MEKKWRTCSLCGRDFFGFGNNPEPLNRFDNRCCDDCNANKVIPARIRRIERDKKIADHIDGYDRDDLGESPDY